VTISPEPVAATRALARRLLVRALLGGSLLLALCTGAIWAAARDTFDAEIQSGFRIQAESVGAGLAGELARALRLGIPIGGLVGVQPLFARLLADHPALAYIILEDPEERTLFVAVQPDLSATIDPRRDTALPILFDGEEVGTLHIGVRTLFHAEFAMTGAWQAALLLITAIALLAALLAALVERDVRAPLALLRRMRALFARGAWGVSATGAGAAEVRGVIAATNSAFDQMAEHRRRLDWLADEVAACEPALADRARASLRLLRGDATGPTLRGAPGAAAPALLACLACLADQLAGSGVALAAPAAEIATDLPPVALAGIVLAAWLGGLLVTTWLLLRFARRLRPALLFAVGALLAASGAALLIDALALDADLEGRALAGAGLACMLSACARAASRGAAGLTAGAASGVAAGAAIGALLAVNLGAGADIQGTILLALLLAAASPVLARSPGGMMGGAMGGAANNRRGGPLAVATGAAIIAAVAGLLLPDAPGWAPDSRMPLAAAIAAFALLASLLHHMAVRRAEHGR
jgi:hypothetical protein